MANTVQPASAQGDPSRPNGPSETPAEERLKLRIYGDPASPQTLIYLPGLHGDWTLIAAFRSALRGRARFVEMTYPRTLSWTLEDYAAAVEQALADHGIEHGWLLGESFGSQLVWPLISRNHFRVDGVILAGGFVRHPMIWAVRMAERLCGRISLRLLTRILFGYAKIARFRFRREPQVLTGLDEFISRRTELDRQAATHRLHLIARHEPGPCARQIQVPLFCLSGWLDPVVPWIFVRRWLKSNCSNLRDFKIIGHADHNVLGTGARASAEQILQWIGARPQA